MNNLSVDQLTEKAKKLRNEAAKIQSLINLRKASTQKKLQPDCFNLEEEYYDIMENFEVNVKMTKNIEVSLCSFGGKIGVEGTYPAGDDDVYNLPQAKIDKELTKRQKALDRLKRKVEKLAIKHGVSEQEIIDNTSIAW